MSSHPPKRYASVARGTRTLSLAGGITNAIQLPKTSMNFLIRRGTIDIGNNFIECGLLAISLSDVKALVALVTRDHITLACQWVLTFLNPIH